MITNVRSNRHFVIHSMWLTLAVGCYVESTEKKVLHTIDAVYFKPNVFDQVGADTTLLTKQLSYLIAKAKEVKMLDLKRVRSSEYPTDKPLLVEGEIFTSVYEGYTSMSTEKVEVGNNAAKAVVKFKNESYNLTWCDTLLLSNENGWKVDDVMYNKQGGTLQKTLKKFVANFEE